jgi:hypothetical protein
MHGSDPMKNDGGVARCRDCRKPVLRSAMGEHVGEPDPLRLRGSCASHIPPEACTKIRKQAIKTNIELEGV